MEFRKNFLEMSDVLEGGQDKVRYSETYTNLCKISGQETELKVRFLYGLVW